MTTETDVNPKWEHRRGDFYYIVQCQFVGDRDTGYHPSYTPLSGPWRRRVAAWRAGLKALGHDDFNLAVVRDGQIVAMLWDDEDIDYLPEELAEVARQTNIGGAE